MNQFKGLVQVQSDEPGPTGSLSPGKIIAWFWTIVAIYISLNFFGYVPGPVTALTFSQWIGGSFIFGVLAAGFYWGMAKGAFTMLTEALSRKIGGDE